MIADVQSVRLAWCIVGVRAWTGREHLPSLDLLITPLRTVPPAGERVRETLDDGIMMCSGAGKAGKYSSGKPSRLPHTAIGTISLAD